MRGHPPAALRSPGLLQINSTNQKRKTSSSKLPAVAPRPGIFCAFFREFFPGVLRTKACFEPDPEKGCGSLREKNASSKSKTLGLNHQVDRFRAFALLVRFNFESDALSFGQILQPRTFDRGDMNENIAPAIVRLDEAIATFSIEELDRTSHGHRVTPPPHCFQPLRITRIGRPDIFVPRIAGRLGELASSPDRLDFFWPSSFRRNHSRKRDAKPV